MKLFTAHKKYIASQKGFTLIELLVVIGILGVLAAALVATIDPFEQLKKANDANVKNTAVEFINANIRYYTTHNAMPWSVDSNCAGGTIVSAATFASANLGSGPMTGCLTALVADGEIKTAFTTVTSVINNIVVSGTENGVTACFKPQSNAQRRDLNTKFNIDGTEKAPNTCLGQGGADSTCYWCSQ